MSDVTQTDLEQRNPEPDFDEALFDMMLLEQVRAIMGVKFPGVLEKFKNSGDKLLHSLWEGEKLADAESMRKAVHGLKGSSASLGANSLSKLCKQLEVDILQGNLSDIACQIIKIEKGFYTACTMLEMYGGD